MRIVVAILIVAFCWSTALARDLGQWAQSSPERRQWFKGLTIPQGAHERLKKQGANFEGCCDDGDRVKTRFRVNKDNADDEWQFLDPIDNAWKVIPNDIIIRDKESPDGEGYLFRWSYDNKTLLCFVPPTGGL